MKIVVVGTRGFPNVQGGIETHCQKLYPRLVKQGHDITVFARAAYVHRIEPYDYEGVHVVPMKGPKKQAIEAFVHTFFCIFRAWRLKPDVVHIHAIGPALFAPFFRLTGARVICTHHGQDYNRAKWGRFAKAILRLGEYMGAHFSHRVIVISEYIETFLKMQYHVQNTVLIRNGVEPAVRLSLETQEPWLEKYGLVGVPYIFALGRFVEEKGFHDLIGAYHQVGISGLRLVIAGKPDHNTLYTQKLVEQARQSNVILPGFIHGEELQALFSGASLFVLPSYHEGLPIALLEALSYNQNIIASNIPANSEIELPEDCYYPVGSVDTLAAKIKEHLSQPDKYDFRDLVHRLYDWDKIAKQTSDVYLGLK